MLKLAILTTHPIQYNAPLFVLLSARKNIQIKVFYTWGESVLEKKYDPGFGKTIEWDIPLLQGYEYSFVKNISANPGSGHFRGIDNPSLINDIKAWNADALLVYGWSFKSHLKCLRYFHKKIPVFFRGDSTLLSNNGGVKSFIRKVFLIWVYKNVDKAFYVGTHNKDYYVACGMRSDQLIFAPHAIDNARFMSEDILRNEQAILQRKSLKIKDNAIVFLYAGKLDENKNVGLLIHAFLKCQQNNTHLIIAGNGSEEAYLKTLTKNSTNIHFLPFQNQQQMPVLYRMCNVFVLPSKSETWGLSINEAMVCKRAILASNTCGAAVDLVDDTNGFIFKSNDLNSLIQQINRLVSKEGLATNMGQNSFKKIQHWSYYKVAEVIEMAVLNIEI